MRDRLLVSHFLQRFLEHDLISPDHDRRSVLSALIGLMLAVSLFTAILIAVPYQFANYMPASLFSLRALDDQFLLVSLSMVVMALAAVGQWDALTLEPRDTATLGTLPISHAMIVRCKGMATALWACVVLMAWNVFPILFHAAALPLGLRIGWLDALRLTAAHGLASGAAGVFGFFAVLGIREASCVLLGTERFHRISAPLQTAIIVTVTSGLLLLPMQSSEVGRRWLAAESAASRMIPPLWFVGVYGDVADPVTDRLPRLPLSRRVARGEAEATRVYDRLRLEFSSFARFGWAALLVVTTVACVGGLWNARRLPTVAAWAPARRGAAYRQWEWLVRRVITRSSLQQAGFFFAGQAVARRPSNRITMAAAVAVAASLVTVVGWPTDAIGSAASVSVARLAVQSLVISAVLTGYRRVTQRPAERRGTLTFSLALPDMAAPFVQGVKRAGWVFVALPTLAVSSVWHVLTLGPRLALLHVGVGVAVAILALNALFFNNRRVPFASAPAHSSSPIVSGMVYVAAVLTASLAVAFAEQQSFHLPPVYVGLITVLLGVSTGVRWMNRLATKTIELDVDEQVAAPTQRLGLGQF